MDYKFVIFAFVLTFLMVLINIGAIEFIWIPKLFDNYKEILAYNISKFHKVSIAQFVKDSNANLFKIGNGSNIINAYEKLKLPVRKTYDSAGYDFFIPYDLELKAGESAIIPTGIKASMDKRHVLMIFPRSGLGFKYRLQLANTVGIVDSDYYNNESNEGHILIKITNDSKDNKVLYLNAGDGFAQGIFIRYGTVEDDALQVHGLRKGGFGSTDK